MPTRAWNARLLTRLPLIDLGVSGGHLYALDHGAQSDPVLYDLDPATGRVLHRRTLHTGYATLPVLAGGLAWSYDGRFALGLDPAALVTRSQVRVRTSTHGLPVLIPGGRRSTVILAQERSITFLDADRVQRSITLPQPAGGSRFISDLAQSPDGSRLYLVFAQDPDNGPADDLLETLDPATGRPLVPARSIAASATGNGHGLAVTAGGVWLDSETTAGTWSVEFTPRSGSRRTIIDGRAGVRDVQAPPTLSGGVIWLVAGDQISCADPDSGRIRARARLAGGSDRFAGWFLAMGVAGRRLDLLYQAREPSTGDLHTAVLAMTPPAGCFAD